MSLQNSQQISDVKVLLNKGMDGNGIVSIEKTGTQDNIDTYTITYEDGGKDTFTVTNGKSINSIVKTGTSGLVDTYTITFNDTQTATFTVTNGRSIVSITKTGSSGGVDTYTIAYNDSTSSTFTVTNGTVATGVSYDDTSTHLQSSNVQSAIENLTTLVNLKVNKNNGTMIGSLNLTGSDSSDHPRMVMTTPVSQMQAYGNQIHPQTSDTNVIYDITLPADDGTVALTKQIERSNSQPFSDYNNIRLDKFGKMRTLTISGTGIKTGTQGNLLDSNNNIISLPSADYPSTAISGTGIGRVSGADYPLFVYISNYGEIKFEIFNGSDYVYLYALSGTEIHATITYMVS